MTSSGGIRRTDKIATMQRLVDEARAGGLSNRTMAEILAAARRKAGIGL